MALKTKAQQQMDSGFRRNDGEEMASRFSRE
jgi:hypothetical protein